MFCFIIGIFLGSTRVIAFPFWSWVLLAVGALLIACTRNILLVILVAGSFGFGYVRTWRVHRFTTYPETSQHFTGIVSDAPDTRQDRTFLTVIPDQLLGKDSRASPVSGAILVQADRFPLFQYGDHLAIEGKIEKPEAFSGFNYPVFLERAGIYGVVSQPKIRILEHNRGSPLYAWLYSLRSQIEQRIQQFISEPESSFLGGILLGSKRSIPDFIQDALKHTGTSHIIAISGANITILLGILLSFLPLYNRWHQFFATLFISAFVCILTGASASVVRGALVASFGSLLRALGRRAWVTPFVLSSVTIMTLNNPLLLIIDPGFQLSFAAYAGLLYLGSGIKVWTERSRLTSGLPPVVQSSFAETAAATLGTAPLSLTLFGQLSLLGLVVNPLILWLLPAITFLGLVFIALGWLQPVAALLALPLWLLLHAVLATIQWFGTVPIGIIHWPNTS
jgi:competence protein ComEC